MSGPSRITTTRVGMATLVMVAALASLLAGCGGSDSSPSQDGAAATRESISTSTGTWVDPGIGMFTGTGLGSGAGTDIATGISTGQGTSMVGTSVCTLCGFACCLAGEACVGLGPTSDGYCTRTVPITSTWSTRETTPSPFHTR